MEIMKWFLLFILIFTGRSVADETAPKSAINRLVSYANFGNGDVFVSLENNGSICSHGYFLNKESKGFKANYSMLLSAYHSDAKVVLIGLDKGEKWQGASRTVCKHYSVELAK